MASLKKLIQLVEDDFLNGRMFQAVLEGGGFAVANDRQGALALQRALTTPPDLFLIDLMLPDVPGLLLIRQLRGMSQFSTTPIIVVTVLAGEEAERKALEVGANLYLRKPVSITVLLASINAQLGTATLPNTGPMRGPDMPNSSAN